MPMKKAVPTRLPGALPVKITGTIVVLLSLVGLVLGLALARSLGDDLRATVRVSRSALVAITETLEAVDMVAADTAASLDSASGSVDSASAAIEGAVVAIEQIADFLDEELPSTIESIQTAMPAAIQTANAVDGALSALSFFGVDYDPEEPFGDSLARVSEALAALPSELQAQSEALRPLTSSGEELGGEIDELSASMDDLTESLDGLTGLTANYQATIAEAEEVIDRTDSTVERSMWLIRALVFAMAIAGMAVGWGLVVVGRSLDTLHNEVIDVAELEEEAVEA